MTDITPTEVNELLEQVGLKKPTEKLNHVAHILNRNLKKYQRELLLNPTNNYTLNNIEWICKELLNLPSTLHLWVETEKEYKRVYPPDNVIQQPDIYFPETPKIVV